MDETKVMEALRIIQKTCNRLFTQIQIDMTVGSCGWKNSTMWYINLTCSNTEWRNLIKELLIVRVFSNRDIPQNDIYVYTTDWAHEGSFFFSTRNMHFLLWKEGDDYVNRIYNVSSSWSISDGRYCEHLDLQSTRLVFTLYDYYCRVHYTCCSYLLDYLLRAWDLSCLALRI